MHITFEREHYITINNYKGNTNNYKGAGMKNPRNQ